MQCNSSGAKYLYMHSPFQSDNSNSDKGLSRKGRPNDNSYTSIANITLVSSSVRDVDAMSTAVDNTTRSTVRSSRKQTPFLEGYKKSLDMEGISNKAAKLTSQSRRSGSIASYKLA